MVAVDFCSSKTTRRLIPSKWIFQRWFPYRWWGLKWLIRPASDLQGIPHWVSASLPTETWLSGCLDCWCQAKSLARFCMPTVVIRKSRIYIPTMIEHTLYTHFVAILISGCKQTLDTSLSKVYNWRPRIISTCRQSYLRLLTFYSWCRSMVEYTACLALVA